jgi:hypothetical protein
MVDYYYHQHYYYYSCFLLLKKRSGSECMYYRTFSAIEQLTASADRTFTDLATREITIPDEIYGFTFWRFCEPHWHLIFRWALRQDRSDKTTMDERSLN